MNWKIRTLGSAAIAGLLVLPGFWLTGFDFDQRGSTAAAAYCITLGVFIAAITCPAWSWND